MFGPSLTPTNKSFKSENTVVWSVANARAPQMKFISFVSKQGNIGFADDLVCRLALFFAKNGDNKIQRDNGTVADYYGNHRDSASEMISRRVITAAAARNV